MGKIGYFAPKDFGDILRSELKNISVEYGQLILASGPLQKVYFAQNIWEDPQIISFTSLSDAANKLKAIQKLWSFYPYKLARKGELITKNLPYFSPKPLVFPAKLKTAPLGSFLLLDENTMLASKCTSHFAQGEALFEESEKPPSKAYLKLYEAFTLLGEIPKKKEKCLEIGASPGSWTYVLQNLGLRVVAVDRAPLAPEVQKLRNITFLKKDAFSLNPEDFKDVTWLFSDVICYPEKLLEWLLKWLEVNPETKCICTLKFQGKGNYGIAKEFEKIPNSFVTHLYNNKHELTFIKR